MPPNDSFPPEPEKLITLAQCEEYVGALRKAITSLEAAGVRVHPQGRLKSELSILERVVGTGIYPSSVAGRLEFANAMSDASDFHDIVHFVPAELSERVAQELGRMMKGRPDEHRENRDAYRLQSQFWLGSILHRGGYAPVVPSGAGTKSPDYLVEEGTHQYGVEIKRPASESSSLAAIRKGVAQLEAIEVKGCVILDLTEVANFSELAWLPRERAAAAATVAKARFLEITRVLANSIASVGGAVRRPEFKNLLWLFFLARTSSWIEGETSGLTLVAAGAGRALIRPVKNLEYHHTLDIVDRIVKGLNRAGFPFEPVRRVARIPDGFPTGWSL